MRKDLIVIAVFLSFTFPVLRTHFFLLSAKYCSGFIFQQHVNHILT